MAIGTFTLVICLRTSSRTTTSILVFTQTKSEPIFFFLSFLFKEKETFRTKKMSTATATALSSSLKHHLASGLRFPQSNALYRRNGAARITTFRTFTVTMAASSASPLEVCVKASVTTPNKPGDCKTLFSVLGLFIYYYYYFESIKIE